MFKRTQKTKDGPAARPAMALVALFALLAICLAPSPAQAAITLKGQFKTEDAYNPKPDGGDLSLPMPCDLAMVFRVVSIPVTGK
ncbi:MAG: hypothetical protein LBF58_02605, partial [Deltaproteobacteria bacterium]|nr:hypothetical protein [Deltaproteobacteria bacterium]